MKLRDDFTYTICNTLLGKKLLVGVKSENSYIEIKKDYMDTFFQLINKNLDEKSLESQLNQKEKLLINLFEKKGYFTEGHTTTVSFNEYNSFVKVIHNFELKNFNRLEIKHKNIFYFFYLIFWIFGLNFIFQNLNYLNTAIEWNNFSVLEIVICFTIVPFMVFGSHEFGHYLFAQFMGLEASILTLGFFVVYPTIYVQYKGLNLNSTIKKVCVITAGLFAHTFNLMIGILLQSLGVESNILLIWNIANVSMIISNITLTGPTDGYFLLTSVVGIFNLRYKGYMFLNRLLKQRKIKASLLDWVCGIVVIFCWGLSFVALIATSKYYKNVFNINTYIIDILILIFIVILLLRFIVKVMKMKN